jgi:hypothetical protein
MNIPFAAEQTAQNEKRKELLPLSKCRCGITVYTVNSASKKLYHNLPKQKKEAIASLF